MPSSTTLLEAKAAATSAAVATEEKSLVNGLASGAVSRVNKELLLHPIDTVRARLQTSEEVRNSSSVGETGLFSNLYDGIVPALVGGVPAGALFFGVKDYSKASFKRMGFSKPTSTVLAVAVTNVPYWLIRSPSEVIKTRRQAGVDGSVGEYASGLYAVGGGGAAGAVEVLRGLYSTYASNYAYACPADIAKFLAYETVCGQMYGLQEGQKVQGIDAAVAGALAGLVSQTLTTPLDVARTRLMTSSVERAAPDNSLEMMASIAQMEGAQTLFSGLTPRAVRAIASGAIQFVSVEYVNDLFRK